MVDISPEFLRVSQALGADPLLIQGAGGNTSIKIDGNLMWVKASGKWLQHADTDEVFVAVDPARVNRNIEDNCDDPVAGAALSIGPVGLRPSIETTLHSLMHHRVVFHTHSINTIVHAVQQNAADILAGKLAGIRWGFIPYSQPGMPLTRLVSKQLAEKQCDVLVIQNHGLVIGGDSPDEALELMQSVEDRLETTAVPIIEPSRQILSDACAGTDFVVADAEIIHQSGLAASGFDLACGGSLYPDHVVFLGSGIAGAQTLDELVEFVQSQSSFPLRPKAVALKGAGVVHHKSLVAGGVEMLKALAEVVRRLPASAAVCYLTEAEEKELVNWDAEKYRQAL